MRALCALLFVCSYWAASLAADLKVKVVDPQSAAVSGAQVSLLRNNGPALHTVTSAGDGTVWFENIPDGEYQVQVLAQIGRAHV